MKVAVFSSHQFERPYLEKANTSHGHQLSYFESHLDSEVAKLAQGFPAVSAFVSDSLDADTLKVLSEGGVKFISLRSAGYNHIDLEAAAKLGISVARVPAYSPSAVAEYTIALMLTLNRKTHKAYNRVREGNFSLDGLIGFEFSGQTAAVIGTGNIGAIVCRILIGFGCRVVAYDTHPSEACKQMGVEYISMEEIFKISDIITLHCPLNPATKYIINEKNLALAKDGVMLINTGRGGLIDTKAVIKALKTGKIGSLGLDVYEEEEELFFEDNSEHIIDDDIFSRLITFPNVVITGHQGFLTTTALRNIAETSLQNISDFESGTVSKNTL